MQKNVLYNNCSDTLKTIEVLYLSSWSRLFTKRRMHVIRRSKFVTQKLGFTKKCKLAKS